MLMIHVINQDAVAAVLEVIPDARTCHIKQVACFRSGWQSDRKTNAGKQKTKWLHGPEFNRSREQATSAEKHCGFLPLNIGSILRAYLFKRPGHLMPRPKKKRAKPKNQTDQPSADHLRPRRSKNKDPPREGDKARQRVKPHSKRQAQIGTR